MIKINNNKLQTIINLFQGYKIRSIWSEDREDYYFSVVDVISALANPSNPRDYWYQLKKRLSEEEKSEVSKNCRQLKMKAQDGKMREMDTLDTKYNLYVILEKNQFGSSFMLNYNFCRVVINRLSNSYIYR